MNNVFKRNPTSTINPARTGLSRNTSSHAATGTYTLHDPTIGKKPMMNDRIASTPASGTWKMRFIARMMTDLIVCVRNVE